MIMSKIKDYTTMFNEDYDKAYKEKINGAIDYFNTLNKPLYNLDEEGNINKNSEEFKKWKKDVKEKHNIFIKKYEKYYEAADERKKKYKDHNVIYRVDRKYENSLHRNWRKVIDGGSNGVSSEHFIIRDDIGIFDINTGDPVLLFADKYKKMDKISEITDRIKNKEIKPYAGLNRRGFLSRIAKNEHEKKKQKEKRKNLIDLGNL
jgi:hypothetical protein